MGLPDAPLRNVPCFISCMARSTFWPPLCCRRKSEGNVSPAQIKGPWRGPSVMNARGPRVRTRWRVANGRRDRIVWWLGCWLRRWRFHLLSASAVTMIPQWRPRAPQPLSVISTLECHRPRPRPARGRANTRRLHLIVRAAGTLEVSPRRFLQGFPAGVLRADRGTRPQRLASRRKAAAIDDARRKNVDGLLMNLNMLSRLG